MKTIINEGKIPIVVGGTGFYLQWYLHGKPIAPVASKELKDEMYRHVLEEGWEKRFFFFFFFI